jgi:hypothetical protein
MKRKMPLYPFLIRVGVIYINYFVDEFYFSTVFSLKLD